MESIVKHKKNYIDDSNYVYKSCNEDWIIVLQKLPETITNETRLNVSNKRFAKFRADKLLVIEIFNKFNPIEKINEIDNNICKYQPISYKIGCVVSADLFDSDLDNICSNGIHYFIDIEAALYYQLYTIQNGSYKSYYENGKISSYKSYYGNGNIKMECLFNNGKQKGFCKSYYEDSEI